ncbi:hypothetical protein C0989_001141 [Termitomyces sp. Mn162]|nr:hypothetical protein C0989_001141 [Termitomyces sp. Mn162]
MLALCRLRGPSTALLQRANATLHAVPPAADTPPPPPVAKAQSSPPPPSETPDASDSKANGRRRRRTPIPPKRPNISLANPRQWNRPIGLGVIPAYDLALELIQRDSKFLVHEAAALREDVKVLESKVVELGGWGSEGAKDVEAEMEKKREKLKILEVQSKVNLPAVRWEVDNAMDVLPDLRPTIDVHVVAQTTSRERVQTKKMRTTVVPGTFLLPGQTIKPLHVYANVFHTDTRLYTMLLVDPEYSILTKPRPNIPLSATTRGRIDLDGHTPYIPPHPQQGTPYHRYVLLLLPQPPLDGVTHSLNAEARAEPGVPTSTTLDIPPVEPAERANFDVRAFVQRWGLDTIPGGGAHMWREVWNSRVSKIYKNVLKELEPRFGRPPKEDPYLEYKEKKRYI